MSLKDSAARLIGAAALCIVAGALPTMAQAQAQLPPIQSDSHDDANGNSLVDMLFDRQSNWHEAPLDALPALPSKADLLAFTLERPSSLDYFIDSKSISISKDGVVRYTVEIDSADGARNIRYEGIHCASYRWRLYSGANSEGTRWDNASTPWTRIENSSLNGYQATLYNNYFCENKMPASSVRSITQNIRYGRSLTDKMYQSN